MVIRRRRNDKKVNKKIWKKLETALLNARLKKWEANQRAFYQ